MSFWSNFSNVILAVIALASIITPFLTSLVNSKTQIKTQQTEILFNQKLTAYQSWCKNASQFINTANYNKKNMFFILLENSQTAAMLCGNNTLKAINEFTELCKEIIFNDYDLSDYCKELTIVFQNVVKQMNIEINSF